MSNPSFPDTLDEADPALDTAVFVARRKITPHFSLLNPTDTSHLPAELPLESQPFQAPP